MPSGDNNAPNRASSQDIRKQLDKFADLIRNIATDETIDMAVKTSSDDLIRGRSFFQIAMDDALEAFERMAAVVQQSPSYTGQEIPLDTYHQIMTQRYGKISEGKARQKLLEKIETGGLAEQFNAQPMPDFLQIVQSADNPALTAALVQKWEDTVLSLGDAFANNGGGDAASKTVNVLLGSLRAQIGDGIVAGLNDGAAARAGQQKPAAAKTGAPASGVPAQLEMYFGAFGDDLTAQARTPDPNDDVLGREDETSRLAAALVRESEPYALSVGKHGAGKSAVTRKLAQKISAGDVPPELKDARIVRLRLREMRAESGATVTTHPRTKEQAQVDQFILRLGAIMDMTAAYNAKGGPQIILNFDDLSEMVGNRNSGISMMTRDLISSKLDSSPHLRVIAEVSDDKRSSLLADMPEAEKFQEVKVKPLTTEQTVELLNREAGRLAAKGIEFPEHLRERIVKMADRYMARFAQPKGSLDILHAAVARAKTKGDSVLTEDHAADFISQKTGIPKELISTGASDEKIMSLRETLPARVLGQPAITKIIEKLEIGNAGLNNPNKPLGSFFSVGPTGVGKTETAEALADLLSMGVIKEGKIAPIKFDMGNFKEKHTVSRLIGAPPGYIGFDGTPELAAVLDNPYSVVLFDEIEKAHEDVRAVLLSILDKGEAKLSNGQTVNFRNSIVIMTSNLGAREAQKARGEKGMAISARPAMDHAARPATSKSSKVLLDEVRKELSPEFFNRIDAILEYVPLNKDVIQRIAIQKVEKVSAFLRDRNRNLALEISPEALGKLTDLGFDPAYGARPMERAVDDYIKSPIALRILRGEFNAVSAPKVLYVKDIGENFAFDLRDPGQPKNAPAPAP